MVTLLKTSRPLLDTTLLFLLYGAILLVSAAFLLKPVNDPDFFWHLKTGEWIWQHRGLPASDPFNFMNQEMADGNQRFTLTAYWLTQVIFHLVHSLLGMPGIAALKFLMVLLIVAALLKLRRGDPVIHAALVLSVLPLLTLVYTYDRPQAFSILFFATLLAILERERTSRTVPSSWQSYLAVPLLMLLWGNMHGGHVLGQITILMFIVLEGVKFAHPTLQPMGRDRYRRLLIVGGAGLIVSLINPNSWHALQVALTPLPVWLHNMEYKSTVAFFRGQRLVAIFWGALALSALAVLFTIRRPDITWIALLAGLGYQGFIHVRYVPFFMIAALPVVGSWLSSERFGRWVRPVLVVGAVALVAIPMKDNLPSRERASLSLRVNEHIYPVRAADFVLANAPSGNLYNTYFWGGYLIWRLGPERKVFVDGRGLSFQPIFKGFSIDIAFSNPTEPPPLWKRLLRQYGIGYLIIPRVDSNAGVKLDEVAKLRTALLESPEWVPVFADAISLVFVKNAPEHRELIRKHEIPRERLLGRRPRI